MKSYARCFVCDGCGSEIDLRAQVNLCPHCEGLLETFYDLGDFRRDGVPLAREGIHSIWRYANLLLPVQDENNIITLGEGGTPLIKSKYLGPSLGVENLYFKNDTMMPTGSFKDRGMSLAVSYAVDIGVQKGFTYSSGNAGTSFSAYSRRAGLWSLVLVEHLASQEKKAMIRLYGANSAIIRFQDFSEVAGMLEKAVTDLGLYQFVNFVNPVRHEAMKTFAYEIFEALNRVPDFMIHPMGTGGGVYGTWKGFKELREVGLTAAVPRMIAVQPEAVCWLKEAIESGAAEGKRFGDPTKTIAQSISANSPLQGGKRLIKCMRESKGIAAAVADRDIIEAMGDLAREGIGAEPSSAATVAAFKRAVWEGTINGPDTAVCVITGTVLKQPSAVLATAGIPEIEIGASAPELANLWNTLSGTSPQRSSSYLPEIKGTVKEPWGII